MKRKREDYQFAPRNPNVRRKLFIEVPKVTARMPRKAYTTRKNYKTNNSFSAKVNRILDKRIESKFDVSNFDQDDIATTPLFSELTNITQGVGVGDRVGNVINPTYCEIKLAFDSSTTAQEECFVRILVVQSREGQIVSGDMPQGVGASPDYDQYNIIYDKLMKLTGNSGAGDTVSLAWNFQTSLRKAGMRRKVVYDDNTGNAISGGVYVFAIASVTTCDINDGYTLIRYKDA